MLAARFRATRDIIERPHAPAHPVGGFQNGDFVPVCGEHARSVQSGQTSTKDQDIGILFPTSPGRTSGTRNIELFRAMALQYSLDHWWSSTCAYCPSKYS